MTKSLLRLGSVHGQRDCRAALCELGASARNSNLADFTQRRGGAMMMKLHGLTQSGAADRWRIPALARGYRRVATLGLRHSFVRLCVVVPWRWNLEQAAATSRG